MKNVYTWDSNRTLDDLLKPTHGSVAKASFSEAFEYVVDDKALVWTGNSWQEKSINIAERARDEPNT